MLGPLRNTQRVFKVALFCDLDSSARVQDTDRTLVQSFSKSLGAMKRDIICIGIFVVRYVHNLFLLQLKNLLRRWGFFPANICISLCLHSI